MSRPAAAAALSHLLGLLLGGLLLTAPPLAVRALPREAPQTLDLRLWCELEPMDAPVGEPLDGEEAARRTLEEARQVFSAMIYGYRFLYVPADEARSVREEFRLEPIGEVAWGDPALRILETERRDGRLYARLEYRLAESQAARRAAWSSNTIPAAAGTGEGSLFRGPGQKRTALEAAIREAIRNHLRPKIFNKPREVRGEVLLWGEPRTLIRASAYVTSIEARVRVAQLVPYRIF